jgi:hypothetical protein
MSALLQKESETIETKGMITRKNVVWLMADEARAEGRALWDAAVASGLGEKSPEDPILRPFLDALQEWEKKFDPHGNGAKAHDLMMHGTIETTCIIKDCTPH